jgi:hypothetical protein
MTTVQPSVAAATSGAEGEEVRRPQFAAAILLAWRNMLTLTQ